MNFTVFDIGSENIKIAEISKRSGAVNVLSQKLIPTPDKAFKACTDNQDGIGSLYSEMDTDILRNKILLTYPKIKFKKAIGIVSNPAVIRNVNIQCPNLRQLKSYIENHIMRIVPDDDVRDKLSFDYISVEKVDDNNYRLLLLGVARICVKNYMRLFESLCLHPYRVDFSGNAVVKYVMRVKAHSAPFAVVDIGCKNLVFSVGHNNGLIFGYAGRHSVVQQSDDAAELIIKIKTAINFYNTIFDLPIEQIYLTKDIGLEKCRKVLGIETTLLDDIADQPDISFFCNCFGL